MRRGRPVRCFTAAQIAALEKIYGDVVTRASAFFRAGRWAPKSRAPTPQRLDKWMVNEGAATTEAAYSESFSRYLASSNRDPTYNLSQFNLDRDPPRLEAIHQVLDATDPDLSRFEQRGGKILMYFGWADPALNPLMGVEYYEQVSQRMAPARMDFSPVHGPRHVPLHRRRGHRHL